MRYRTKSVIPIIVLIFAFSVIVIYQYIPERENSDPAIQSNRFDPDPVWSFETKEIITSTALIDETGKAYIRTADSIIALDLINGKLLWQVASPSNTPLNITPHIGNGVVVVPEKQSRVAAFNSETGELLWRTALIDLELTHPSAVEIESISIEDDMVYAVRFNWTLTAYQLASGQIVWEQEVFGRSNPYVVSDQKSVYLGMGSSLKAFDRKSGILLWQKELDAYIGPMLDVQGILYIVDEEHSSLYAIDVDDQEILWSNHYPELEEFEFGCLSDVEDKLLIASQSLSLVSKANGQMLWSTNTLGRLECPTVLNNEVFVRNTRDILYSFDLSTGKEDGRLTVVPNLSTKHEPNRGPASSAGFLLVPVSDNQMVAYRP